MSDANVKEKSKDPVNHLATNGLTYCCGMVELGNFNYNDPPGTPDMTHYHKLGGGWKAQGKKEEGNTLEQVKAHIQWASGGVMATTGAGQEYMEPILASAGFKNVFTFKNPGHANTLVKVWCYSKNEVATK